MSIEAKETEESKTIKDPENRFLEEIQKYVGDSPDQSFISLLTSNLMRLMQEKLKSELLSFTQDKLKSELSLFTQDQILPTIRNIEVQTALQISKTNESFSECKKVTDHLSMQISKFAEHFNLLKANLVTINEKHENIAKLTAKKADLYELQAFAKELTTMTPLHTFYKFQDWAQNLASKEELLRVDREVELVKNRVNQLASLDFVQDGLSKVIVELRSELNREKNFLSRKVSKLKENNSENKEKIEGVKQSIKQTNEIVSKRIHEIVEMIQDRPWRDDLQVLDSELKNKASFQQLEDVKSLYEPKINAIVQQNQEITEDLKDYSDVMARFDEVILTKSSKEDLKVLQKIMKTLAKRQEIEEVFEENSQSFKKIEEKLKNISKIVEDVNDRITAYHSISALLKTQTKDYSKMMESIKSINETLKYKADKSDIYGIFDVVGYRDDIVALASHLEHIKELFLQTVVLQHDTVGTLMPSADPQNAKNRVRAEVVKHLDLIAKKVNSLPEKIENKTVRPERSRKKIESLAPISSDNTVDEKILSSRNSSVKHKRIFSAVGNKRFVNIFN
jgi:hypothetical protein